MIPLDYYTIVKINIIKYTNIYGIHVMKHGVCTDC